MEQNYSLITFYYSQYGNEKRLSTTVVNKSVTEFLVWNAKYITENPNQQYSMPDIIFAKELTEEEYNTLKNFY